VNRPVSAPMRPVHDGGSGSAPMRPAIAVRVFAAFLVARAIFGLSYLAAAVGGLPVFWYYPLEHAWRWSARRTGRRWGGSG
jgi:hypothetical protein